MNITEEYITPTLSAHELSGPDGPYASMRGDHLKLLYVDKDGELVMDVRSTGDTSVVCSVDNDEKDSFVVTLQGESFIKPPESIYSAPKSIVTISDIEGNFNALYSLLVSNKIMNSDFQWIFEANHLVILGDAIDKGQNVTQCLWLIYHLEYQAQAQGGYVHYLLGNHELMDLSLDIRYVHDKYLALARKISETDDETEAYRVLLDRNSIITDWLKSKNCMEKIGDTLFVHAGISPEYFSMRLSIQQTNFILHKFLNKEFTYPRFSEAVLSVLGPLWYRGFVRDSTRDDVYQKVDEPFINEVLEFYDVKRIVIGHTIVKEVSSDYNNKVWRVDVLHSEERFSYKSEALLIEGISLYRLNGAGGKIMLNESRSKINWNRQSIERLLGRHKVNA